MRTAVLDPCAPVFQPLAGHRMTFRLENRTFPLEAFAATKITFAAILFSCAARFLTLALELLVYTARFLAFARAFDGLAGTTLGDRLRTRLCGKNQERKSRKQRGKLASAEHVLSLLASFDAAGHRLFSADAHLTVASDCHAPAPAYVCLSVA